VVAGPAVDLTPVPSLAGILLVMAADLVDLKRIREVISADRGDWMAFLGTVIGTWVLPLDQAILLGVAISIVIFLRRVRHLVVRELAFDEFGRLRERDTDNAFMTAPGIKVLHVQGNLFFGAANELRDAIDDAMQDSGAKVLVLRLKRTQGMDLTTASVLLAAARGMERRGQHLLLVGVLPRAMELLVRTGIADELGHEGLFPSQSGWFAAMDQGLRRAVELAETPVDCPMRAYLAQRALDHGPTTPQSAAVA
jgi:SulP family sulfate permease